MTRLSASIFSGICLMGSICGQLVFSQDSPSDVKNVCDLPKPDKPFHILIFKLKNSNLKSNSWLSYLLSEDFQGKYQDYFRVELVELPDQLGFPLKDNESLAVHYGLGALPVCVLQDSKLKYLNLFVGDFLNKLPQSFEEQTNKLLSQISQPTIQERALEIRNQNLSQEEEAQALCDLLKSVPPLAWKTDYSWIWTRLMKAQPQDARFLAAQKATQQLEWQKNLLAFLPELNKATQSAQIRDFIKTSQALLSETNNTYHRQVILVNALFPAFIKLEQSFYKESHNAESEQAFQDAISALEQARDMDKNSQWGKWAHSERERLRSARLQAAKYD